MLASLLSCMFGTPVEDNEEQTRPPPTLPQQLPSNVLMHILAHTGDPTATKISHDTSIRQWTPQDIALLLLKRLGPTSALIRASQHGKTAVVAALLLYPGVHADAQHSVALIVAAAAGHISICKLLLNHPTHPAHPDAWNSLPLETAANAGHLAICRLLLRHPTHPARPDDFRCWALLYAASHGHLQVCELLLDTAERYPARADANCSEALALAASWGHIDVCNLLLNQLKHPARADMHDSMALLYAARHGHVEVCNLLISFPSHPAQPNELMIIASALCGNLQIFQLLLHNLSRRRHRLHQLLPTNLQLTWTPAALAGN